MNFLTRRLVLPGFMYNTLPTFYFVHGILFVMNGGNQYVTILGAILIPASFILKLVRMNGGI